MMSRETRQKLFCLLVTVLLVAGAVFVYYLTSK